MDAVTLSPELNRFQSLLQPRLDEPVEDFKARVGCAFVGGVVEVVDTFCFKLERRSNHGELFDRMIQVVQIGRRSDDEVGECGLCDYDVADLREDFRAMAFSGELLDVLADGRRGYVL